MLSNKSIKIYSVVLIRPICRLRLLAYDCHVITVRLGHTLLHLYTVLSRFDYTNAFTAVMKVFSTVIPPPGLYE